MSQSIEVLDRRTQRDLQYVEKMENQMRGLESKFKQVEETHKQHLARQFKVSLIQLPPPVPFICVGVQEEFDPVTQLQKSGKTSYNFEYFQRLPIPVSLAISAC